VFFGVLILLLFFGRSLCSLLIDYKWWGEMGQVSTWQRMWMYRFLPDFAQWLILALVLWIAHSRGMHYAGTSLRLNRRYAVFATGAILLISLVLATSSIDGWVIARFIGGRGVDSSWHDPVFGRSLVFYFFELPFYTQLTGFLEVCAAAGAIVYYVTARVWQVRTRFPDLWASGQLNWDDVRRLGRLETGIFKVLLAFFLAGLSAYFWLGRYELLYTDHGELMTGIDYVQQHIGLPLQTAKAVAALLAERVTRPLGLASTGFYTTDPSRLVTQYAPSDAGLRAIDLPDGRYARPPVFESLGGGLVSTVEDYLSFLSVFDGGSAVLSAADVRLMTSESLTPEQRSGVRQLMGPDVSWGFCVGVDLAARQPWMAPGRFGWNGGSGTTAYVDPSRELTVVLLTQRTMQAATGDFDDFYRALAEGL